MVYEFHLPSVMLMFGIELFLTLKQLKVDQLLYIKSYN